MSRVAGGLQHAGAGRPARGRIGGRTRWPPVQGWPSSLPLIGMFEVGCSRRCRPSAAASIWAGSGSSGAALQPSTAGEEFHVRPRQRPGQRVAAFEVVVQQAGRAVAEAASRTPVGGRSRGAWSCALPPLSVGGEDVRGEVVDEPQRPDQQRAVDLLGDPVGGVLGGRPSRARPSRRRGAGRTAAWSPVQGAAVAPQVADRRRRA